MDYVLQFFDAIKGNNGTWVQALVISLILHIRLWIAIPFFIYYLKIVIKNKTNIKIFPTLMCVFFIILIGYESATIYSDRQFETKKYNIEYVKKTTNNLVIVIQGVNNPFKDFITKNKTQVDITNSRDENGLGYLKSKNFTENTQVLSYVSTHSENLTPEDIYSVIYYYKLFNPNGKVIMVGHSIGGYNIIQVANRLSKDKINIDLSILIDPANKKENNVKYSIPNNINKLINLTSPEYSDNFKFFTNSGGKSLTSTTTLNYVNIDIKNTTHTSIDNIVYFKINNLIKDYIQKNVNPINEIKKYKF
jgi:hypothetical protein